MRPASLRLNVRVFSVFLVVGLLMLVAASYFVIGVGQAGLRNAGASTCGRSRTRRPRRSTPTCSASSSTPRSCRTCPRCARPAAAGSQRPFDRAKASATDRDWQRAGAAVPEKQEVTGSKVSAFLAGHDQAESDLPGAAPDRPLRPGRRGLRAD